MKTAVTRTADYEPIKNPLHVWGIENIELEAIEQVERIAQLPFVHHHVALMPDAHWGRGACVGSVVPTIGAIIPAAVGVDIGCGMLAAKLDVKTSDLPSNLGSLRAAIEKAVPHGRTNNGGPGDRGAWKDVPDEVAAAFEGWLSDDYEALLEFTPELKPRVHPAHQLATLGTGNHFIELCTEGEDVWIVLHTGSRGIGNRIGTHWIEKAKEDMRTWFVNLPDEDLAYLPEGTQHFNAYADGVRWAQKFARISRATILNRVMDALTDPPERGARVTGKYVDCHHNYVERENHYSKNVWLTRKGAIRARSGDIGIIPGSMGKGSYIVEGLGNFESFNSASHGAGRRLGRREAKRLFSVADLKEQTEGVECRKDADVIDEIPAAYKNLEDVMAAQDDLVKIKHKLNTILCVKG